MTEDISRPSHQAYVLVILRLQEQKTVFLFPLVDFFENLDRVS